MPSDRIPLARGRSLALARPLVMGILNVTPDSFSDGAALPTPEAAVARARELLAQGADLLDIGGESTRPGHAPVAPEEELRRVVPAILALRQALPDAVLSIDTRKATVASAALAAGGDLVNDVSALGDPRMGAVVGAAGCAIVLMRNQPLHGEVVAAARAELDDAVRRAMAAGIRREAIVLDPGLGFGDPPGADVAANLALLRASRELGGGLPVLVGASRKRVIGTLTGEPIAARRVGGSVAAALLAVQGGASMVRVHDVKDTVDALRVLRNGVTRTT